MSKIQRRGLAGAIQTVELKQKLARVRAALGAAERAPDSEKARKLRADLAHQVKTLQRDLARAQSQTNVAL